jgi:hypothetical protein
LAISEARDSSAIKSAAATALFGQFDKKVVCSLEKSEALKIRQSTIIYADLLGQMTHRPKV